jgi:hypothetical protein
MGVRLDRAITIAQGKGDEATKFATDVCSYLGELTGVTVIWGLEVGGTVGRMHFYADYESLAALEATFTMISEDAGYEELLATGTDLFDGAAEDTWVYTR